MLEVSCSFSNILLPSPKKPLSKSCWFLSTELLSLKVAWCTFVNILKRLIKQDRLAHQLFNIVVLFHTLANCLVLLITILSVKPTYYYAALLTEVLCKLSNFFLCLNVSYASEIAIIFRATSVLQAYGKTIELSSHSHFCCSSFPIEASPSRQSTF